MMRKIPLAALFVAAFTLAAAAQQEPLLPPTVPGEFSVPPEANPSTEVGADDYLVPIPDIDFALNDGFTRILLAERSDDERTPIIRKEFVIPLEASVGQDGKSPFEWALIDLTGDGYSDLVLTSRASRLRDGSPQVEGVRILAYAFNGLSWDRILDATGMEVAYKDSTDAQGKPVHELALIQPRGYILYELKDKKYVRVREVKRPEPPQ